MRRAQKLKVQAIQKEQVQLVQIEKCLETLLGDINKSINSLKVEDLQLKSSLVEHFTTSHYEEDEQKPTTSADAAFTGTTTTSLTAESINKQLLDLETLLVPMKSRAFAHNEEEEEEDDDEDEVVGGNLQEGAEDDEMEDDEEFLPE